MNVVIPAGGMIPEEYAQRIGTPFRALAPMGSEQVPVLQRVVSALRGSGSVTRIIGVACAAVQERIEGVDLWLDAGPSGSDNICRGLAALEEQETPALVCASDLPLLRAQHVQEFLRSAREDADISVGLVSRSDYEKAFPASPMSVFTALHGEDAVTLSCLFRLRPAALQRNRPLLQEVFSARKSQWKMARLLGPRLLAGYACRRLSLRSIQARADFLLHCRSEVLRDCPPELAFDIDTVDDYSYANTCLYQANAAKTIA